MSSDRQKPNNVPECFPALLEAMAVQQNYESFEFMYVSRQAQWAQKAPVKRQEGAVIRDKQSDQFKRMLEGGTTEVSDNRNS